MTYGWLSSGTDGRHNRQTANDPVGNRVAERETFPALPQSWPGNRISEDAHSFYHHDEYGRLTEKDERRIHPQGSITHHYGYDNQHRLTHYRRMQNGRLLTEGHTPHAGGETAAGRRVGAGTGDAAG